MMNFIRAVVVLFAGMLALAAPAVVSAEGSAMDHISKDKTLRVGWAVWNPYVYRDPKTNSLVGISYDLVEDLGKALGAKVEWVEDSWATLPAGIQAHKFDITNLMAITPPRAEAIDFSHPVTKQGLSLIAPHANVAKTKDSQE
jgi:ABC-type amino acid transport substrate-binding protein